MAYAQYGKYESILDGMLLNDLPQAFVSKNLINFNEYMADKKSITSKTPLTPEEAVEFLNKNPEKDVVSHMYVEHIQLTTDNIQSFKDEEYIEEGYVRTCHYLDYIIKPDCDFVNNFNFATSGTPFNVSFFIGEKKHNFNIVDELIFLALDTQQGIKIRVDFLIPLNLEKKDSITVFYTKNFLKDRDTLKNANIRSRSLIYSNGVISPQLDPVLHRHNFSSHCNN